MRKQFHTILRVGGPITAFLGMLIGVLLLRDNKIPAGLAVIAAAGLIFALIAIYAERRPAEGDPLPVSVTGPAVLWLASISLMVVIGMNLVRTLRTITGNHNNALLWALSILLAMAAAAWMLRPRLPGRAALRAWYLENRLEILIVAFLVLVGLSLRTILLVQHPYPWSGDEASIGMEARRILNGQVTDLFTTGWSGQPNWSFVPDAISILLVGDTVLSMRMVTAVAGTLSVLTLYLFAREAFGKRTAMLAAAFLAAYPYHLHFSRVGVHNIMDSLAVTLVLWLILRAVRLDRPADYVWPGLVAGLTIYTYVGTRLVALLTAIALGYIILSRRGFLRAHWRHLAFFVVGALITAGPLTLYFTKFPDLFMTRLSQEGIIFNNWLPRYAELTGKTTVQILLEQVRRSVMVFVASPAPGNFFNSPQSYLTLLGSILLLLGMVYSLRRLLDPRYALLLTWFWLVVTLGSILTLNPPANTRMVMTAPAVALLIAIGIEQSGDLLKRLKLLNEGWATGLAVAAIAVLFFQNAYFYFGTYRSDHLFQDANGELAMEAGLELQQLGPGYSLYMLGHPRVYTGFPTIPYLNPSNYRLDLRAETLKDFALREGEPALFIATPDNRPLLNEIMIRYPGGTFSWFLRQSQPEILYYAYRLDP